MGIANLVRRAGQKASDQLARKAALSPEQVANVAKQREEYLSEKPDPNDPEAVALTQKLLAANSIEIYNAYLPQIHDLYAPVECNAEYDKAFDPAHNIRYLNITKWVTDKKENSLEKLVNVYEVLSNEECNIALVFHRSTSKTDVYLAVTNTKNADDNVDVNNYIQRIEDAIRGSFPGAEWVGKKSSDIDQDEPGVGTVPCLKNDLPYSVASATNIPTEKSEKFISQTIEKLLDGIVPDSFEKEYTLILLATPVQDVAERKLRLEEIYSGLMPYAAWETNYTFTQSDSTGSMATFGVNVGASAGIQHGTNQAVTNTDAVTDSENNTQSKTAGSSNSATQGSAETNSEGQNISDAQGTTKGESSAATEGESSAHASGTSNQVGVNTGVSYSSGVTAQAGVGIPGGPNASAGGSKSVEINAGVSAGHGWNQSDTLGKNTSTTIGKNTAESTSHTIANSTSRAVAKSVSNTIARSASETLAKTLGHAVSKSVATTSGLFKATNFGANIGANFARTSSVTATVGKNEGITQHFGNYNVKHTLELLEEQMKRLEQSTALGMWDFAAYVLSEDQNVANNVAHSYLALTQGEKSYMSTTAVNLWRGDMDDEHSGYTREICLYLRGLRHPMFCLNPDVVNSEESYKVYPPVITATTSLTGKELAYSLNFPRKSVAGMPVFECAEFGRNIVTFENAANKSKQLSLGYVFHMNHMENTDVSLNMNSLTSHTFITGSTGSGKSNTVYQLLNEANDHNVKFLVIEPAKGEYKDVFGSNGTVVYGTNPNISQLLKLNPFSFPKGIHVFEHMDRLVELFNVCWPMYAAMPAVLKAAVEQSYVDCGWDLIASANPYGDNLYPNFADVARNVREIIDKSDYDVENKGAYKGSLLTRLQSLANGINGLIFTNDEISIEDILNENTVIDLSRVGSAETKSLIMGMLVLKLQEYYLSDSGMHNRSLRHLTVLEEAHNLLKRSVENGQSESGNLLGKSVEMISNAIAEMRTYGEGFIIVDQAPGLLYLASIRNTNTKIIMRLPDYDDRNLVGKAANLNDDQINELAKLPCGVAAVYQNEWIQPVLCKVNEVETTEKRYVYTPKEESTQSNDLTEKLKIAEMLSKGTKIDNEDDLRELRAEMQKLQIASSIQVLAIRMLVNPAREPRMTKLAPVMNALFPEVTASVRNAYSESNKPVEWTESAEESLRNLGVADIDAGVRRDIIQGIMAYYLYVQNTDQKAYRDWWSNGGLK